jgi:hypothetical protein
MTKLKSFVGIALAVAMASGCEVFTDPTPEFINFRMEGTPGEVVQMLYTKQFVAGVDETGVTRLRLFSADTVVHVLPIDTIIDVRLEQRLYMEAIPFAGDTISVTVRVDVDGRNLFNRSGSLFPSSPWQFLYQYNQAFTDDVQVII